MKALASAYPGIVGPAVFRGGDWAVTVNGVYYYYAEGRLLPESLRAKAADYSPQPFYTYPAELPAWKAPTAAEVERYRGWQTQREATPPRRSPLFFDDLWRSHNRAEAYSRLKTIRFLGQSVNVHYSIMEELSLVEERIEEEARKDAAVRAWVKGLKSVTCWNWRTVADTASRSFHSYGAALDLMAAPQPGLETYWLWTRDKHLDWWAVPYTKRQHPPKAVIKAFESQGFCWGGKWPLYDTMHFEYRPEILIMNGMNEQ
jgi:hypothetical protein